MGVPAVLGDDTECQRCCNLESTVVESTLVLVQCKKDGVDCPDQKKAVDEYLPEYMRCLVKRRGRAVNTQDCENTCHGGICVPTCARDGRGLQWIMSLLPSGVTNALGMGGDESVDDGEGSDSDSDGSEDDSEDSGHEGEDSEEETEEEMEEETAGTDDGAAAGTDDGAAAGTDDAAAGTDDAAAGTDDAAAGTD